MGKTGLFFRIQGQVEAELVAGIPGVFFNDAMNGGIPVKHVRHTGSSVFFSVLAADYPKLRRAAKHSGGRMRIVKKRGIPFAIRRLPFPLPLAAGLCVMAMVIAVFGSMVFTVRISGNSTIPRAQILEALEENGVVVGSWQSSHDFAAVANRMMLRFDRLTWMTINPHFGAIEVQIWDKIPPSEQMTGESNAQIVAKKDAQIKSIDLVSGVSLVQPGAVVQQGDPLVIPDPEAMTNSWASGVQAQITGYTTASVSFDTACTVQQTEPTGQVKKYYGFSFGLSDPFFPVQTDNGFQEFSEKRYSRPFYIFGVELPLRLEILEMSETKTTAVTLDQDQARELLEELRKDFESQMQEVKILNRNVHFSQNDSGYTLKVDYLLEESIGEIVLE